MLGLSISENIVRASEILLSNEKYLQPTLFALQVSLARLWMFYGYRPDGVTGISLGEISAAYVAGSISLKDAARLISLRSQYLVQYATGMQFCLVELEELQLKDLMGRFPDLEIAGFYSENSYLLASDAETLGLVQKDLDELGLYCRRAETTVASHCSSVDVFLDLFARQTADVEFKPGNCRIYSTAYGRCLKPGDYQSSYWKDNLRNPFQFHQVRTALLQQGYSIFIELSAHPLTSYYFLKGNQGNNHVFQPSLVREKDSWDNFTQSVRTLYQRGVNPAAGAGDPGFIDLLPLYPWDRSYFEIPYDNYGYTEEAKSLSMEYMLPEWKPVADDGSGKHDTGDIHLVCFQGQRLFNGQFYQNPDDLILRLGQAPPSNSTIILDLHGIAGLHEVEAVVNWTQALHRARKGNLNLVFLVSNSFRVTGREKQLNEVGYGWLGFTRSLKTEWEKGAIQWVDIGNASYEELIDFISSDSSFDPFCIRDSRKYKLHVRSESLRGGGGRNPKSALIIGGTSEMGLIMAQEYVRLGAKHLVLHGKRPVQPEGSEGDSERNRLVRAEVRKWESEGVQVTCTSGDISSPATVETIRGVLQDKAIALDDFVLAAGTSEYFHLLEQDPADFTQQATLRSFGWRPIVEMANPGRVIIISSASSIFNSPGQGAYLFSNHVLDAWSSGKRNDKQSVFAILFPIWSDVGKTKELGFLPETLLEHASRNDLVQHFRHLVSVVDPPPVIIAADLANNNTRSLWKSVPFIPEGKLKHKIKEIMTESVNLVGQEDGRVEKDVVTQVVNGLWYELLGERELLNHHHFFQLGGNSVLLVKLSNRLKERFPDLDLSVRDLIQNLTFQEQVELIKSRVTKPGEAMEFELTRAEPNGIYLASEEQKQIWIQNQLEENSALYNLTGAYFFKGNLNAKAFEKAVLRIAEEQEIFRTRYFLEEGLVYQAIDESAKLNIRRIELDSPDQLETAVKNLFKTESSYSFDLEEEHPFRIFILRSGDQGAFILNLHHIAADGWALGYYTRRLNELYIQFSDNIEPVRKVLGIQYKDYSVYQQEKYLTGERGKRDEQFWMEMLKKYAAESYLIQDRERSSTYSYSGEKVTRLIDESLFRQVQVVKNKAQVSLFSFLQASLSLLLCIKSGKKTIVTGTPFSSRIDKRLEEVVGNFVNLLPIQLRIEEDDTVVDYISKVQLHLSKVIQHQSYPFNLMVQKSGFKRDPSRHPIFDILFVLQNHEEASFELQGLEIKRKFIDPEHSKLDLFIELRESNGSLEFNFEYNDLIFDRENIEDLFREWQSLLEYIGNQPDAALADVITLFSVEKEFNQNLL
jgi:aryl carrier-like protein